MKSGLALLLLLIATAPSYADSGVGSDGINATGLMLPNGTVLTGATISIGQVEGPRPGKPTTKFFSFGPRRATGENQSKLAENKPVIFAQNSPLAEAGA